MKSPRHRIFIVIFSTAIVFFPALYAHAAATAEVAAPATMEIINADTLVRVHIGFRTVELADENGKIKPLKEPFHKRRHKSKEDCKVLPVIKTPFPPSGWMKPEFDDTRWAREIPNLVAPAEIVQYGKGAASSTGNATEWSLICTRAKFTVKEPAAVRGLKASLRFGGGAVLYINGKELTRSHMPKGVITTDTLAEAFPKDAYVDPEGYILKNRKKYPDNFAKRVRTVETDIPASMLQKGVNVLAIELHRAPLSEVFFKHKEKKRHYKGAVGPWAHVSLQDITVTAQPGSAIEPNIGRPKNIQAWAAPGIDHLLVWHWGDPNERTKIDMVGCRNGQFSGRVVIGSPNTITGVNVKTGDLVGPAGAKISAAAIKLRYALRANRDRGFMGDWSPNGKNRYEILQDEPPAEVEPGKTLWPRSRWGAHASFTETIPPPGALLPIWYTVKVPTDAKPGIYKGSVTVQADGLPATDMPVQLKVNDWAVPDPKDFVSCNLFWQSHETTAIYYKVPYWSDRHFELMGQVLELTEPLANKFCNLNLVAPHYHQGNSESMVRWIPKARHSSQSDGGKKPDGNYDHDFSVFDKYLDLYEKTIGKPSLVFLAVFVTRSDMDKKRKHLKEGTNRIKVTRLDPATGKTEPMEQPLYGTEESVKFWQPVLAKARERLVERGWWDRTAIGAGADTHPTAETVSAFKKALPDGRWMSSGHVNPSQYKSLEGFVPVPWREAVWGQGRQYDPDAIGKKRSYPMPGTDHTKGGLWPFMRVGQSMAVALHESSRMMLHKEIVEASVRGSVSGVGRIGADYWPLPGARGQGKYGMRIGLSGNTGMHLSVGASTRCYTAPGPKGPVSVEQALVFAEGVQIKEAILFLQKQAKAGKLTPEQKKRMDDLLDWRARYYNRTLSDKSFGWVAFEGSDWRARDGQLFQLCAEVAGSE